MTGHPLSHGGVDDSLTLEWTPRFTFELMSTSTQARPLRVAELAETVNVSPDTLRFYEREGLLPPPARSPAGYRQYDNSAIERVRFIQGCQRLGLRLKEIADLLAIRDTGECPCEPASDLLHRRLAEIDAEMVRLSNVRQQIAAMAEAIPATDCPPPPAPGASWYLPSRERR